MDLFLSLMAHRKKNPISMELVDSLNKIDVVFQDCKQVRAAWRAYLDSLHPNSQHFDNTNSFQLDLLSEIANELGYKNLKQTELDRFYSPQGHGTQAQIHDLFWRENIRVLMRTKSQGIAFTDEEFEAHKKGLGL